ncbi:hypothetical protein EGU81_01700 [Pseudomonas syringae pv. theae]|nr:hypothetical protein [Pseudomonas syringae pv. theae]MBL3837182.1 hypothetical protein [Pseudomonas syringae pv. theae]
MLFRFTHFEKAHRFNIMANVFRNEVVLKGSDEAIAGFINQYFSVEQDRKFIDFEKLLPLEGKEPCEVWGSNSEAYNFAVVKADFGIFKFKFDTNTRPPSSIIGRILREKDKFEEIKIVSCCEQLSEVLMAEEINDLRVTHLYWDVSDKLYREVIKKTAKRLWGYSKRPNLEEQGFINIGGGHFIKAHFGLDCLKDLYPRFKKS